MTPIQQRAHLIRARIEAGMFVSDADIEWLEKIEAPDLDEALGLPAGSFATTLKKIQADELAEVEEQRMRIKIHTDAVAAVVRFLERCDEGTAREAIQIYLENR